MHIISMYSGVHYEAAHHVTIDSDSYQLLKSADVNISALVNRAMQNEARRLRAERWQAENQEGMAEVARFIEMNGSFADENRDW
jgi:antitoxin CcdA